MQHPSQQVERVEATPAPTCSACPYFQQFDGEQRGYCHRQDTDKVVKAFHERTPSCDLPDDGDYASPQAELNQMMDEQAQEIAPETSAPEPAPKAAALVFQQYGSQLTVRNAEGHTYPMALNGKWCGCPGHKNHGHCYHRAEFQRREQLANRLPAGAMRLPARLLKAGDEVQLTNGTQLKVWSVGSAQLKGAWAGCMGVRVSLVPSDFNQLSLVTAPKTHESAEWAKYWKSADDRRRYLESAVTTEVCPPDHLWIVLDAEDYHLPF